MFYITTLFSISIVELLVLILARAPIGIVSLGEPCPAHRLYMQGFLNKRNFSRRRSSMFTPLSSLQSVN